MPASSHGLPTSGMRDIRLPVFGFRIFTLSIHGRCGVWPSNSFQPSTARAFSSSRLPITSKSVGSSSSTQIGSARPQNRFFEIIQSPMFRSQSSSRAVPLIDSGRNVTSGSHHLHDLAAEALLACSRRPHVDEPLVHEPVEQFRLAPPAVRVAVDVRARWRTAGPSSSAPRTRRRRWPGRRRSCR